MLVVHKQTHKKGRNNDSDTINKSHHHHQKHKKRRRRKIEKKKQKNVNMAEKDNGKYHYETYTQLPKPPIGSSSGPLMGGGVGVSGSGSGSVVGGPAGGGISIRREFQGASKMSPSESGHHRGGVGGGIGGGGVRGGMETCCACNSAQNGPFWVGLLTNLGICALLFAYTLLGK